MERNTFNINFYVQKTRIAKNGEVPVVMRVTINGQRVVTSVNLKVEPKKWNAATGKSSSNTRKDYELNARIDTIRARVMQVYRETELDREPISAFKMVDKYLGRNEKPVVMLLALFREHNEKCRKLSGNGMAPGTVERKCCHNSAVKYLKNFGKIIRIALANGYITKDPFVNIRFKMEEVD